LRLPELFPEHLTSSFEHWSTSDAEHPTNQHSSAKIGNFMSTEPDDFFFLSCDNNVDFFLRLPVAQALPLKD
jgi:hypothetical protein